MTSDGFLLYDFFKKSDIIFVLVRIEANELLF